VLGVGRDPAAARSESEEGAAAEALHVLADGFTGMLGVCQLIGESRRWGPAAWERQLQVPAPDGSQQQPGRREEQTVAADRVEGRARRSACALLEDAVREQLEGD
jgi:hypothetical protein